MKTILTFVFVLFCFPMFCQDRTPTTGPHIENFGKAYTIPEASLLLEKDKVHYVIFDVFSDNSKKSELNPLLVTVARHLNMHGKQGVPLNSLKTVLIVHGSATTSILNENVYQEKFNRTNPDQQLIEDLSTAGVEIFVCGQSLLAKGFSLKDVHKDVKVALSAITTLTYYQENGYSLINFN